MWIRTLHILLTSYIFTMSLGIAVLEEWKRFSFSTSSNFEFFAYLILFIPGKYISLSEFFVLQAAPFHTIIILLPSSYNLSKSNDSIFCLLYFFVCLFQTHFVCIFSIFFMYSFFFCLFCSDIFWFRFLLYSFIFCFLSQTYSVVNFFFALFFYFFFVR